MIQDFARDQASVLPCPDCGKPCTEREIFCRYCGTRLAKPARSIVETFPVESRLAGSGAAPLVPQPAALAPVPAPPIGSGPACPECGKPVSEKDIFCRHCGSSLDKPLHHDSHDCLPDVGVAGEVLSSLGGQAGDPAASPTEIEARSSGWSEEAAQVASTPMPPPESVAAPASLATAPGLTQQVKGPTTCPNCKTMVWPKSDGTCPSCQFKFPAFQNEPETIIVLPASPVVEPLPGMLCPNCGKPAPENDLFCQHCGTKLVPLIAERAYAALQAELPPVGATSVALPGTIEVVSSLAPVAADKVIQAPQPLIHPQQSAVIQPVSVQSSGAVRGTVLPTKPATAAGKPQGQVPVVVHFEVRLPGGATRTFDSVQALQSAIMEGAITRSLEAKTITIGADKKRKESKESSVEKIANSNAILRPLYRPIWDYTLKYITYGAIVFICLKAIDTTVTLFIANLLVGFLWLAVIGSVFLGKKWPAAPMVVIVGSVLLGLKVNLFFALLATSLVGFLFGAPVGMVLGTVVGFFRRTSRPRAPDASPEGMRPFYLGILLPVLVLAVEIPLYIWLNMNMANWLY